MTSTSAMQEWLALEHEAVWFYPIVGARLDGLLDVATTSFEAHRDTRDGLASRLRAVGADPAPTLLTYDIGPVSTEAEARAAAQSLEARISAACLTLVGRTQDVERTYALRHLRRAALAELTWGAQARAFPGLP